MTFDQFHNALRVLLNIDYDEFAQAVNKAQTDLPPGFPRDEPEEQWPVFRDNPHMWMVRAPTPQAEAIWSIVEARSVRKAA